MNDYYECGCDAFQRNEENARRIDMWANVHGCDPVEPYEFCPYCGAPLTKNGKPLITPDTEPEEKFFVINRKFLDAVAPETRTKFWESVTQVNLELMVQGLSTENKFYYVVNEDEPYSEVIFAHILHGEAKKNEKQ
jgi:hypothetical protein